MKFRLLFLSFVILLSVNYANAQGDCLDPDGHPIPCPIDGGASLLVGAGIAYGMKKIRDNKKSRKDLKDTI